MTKAQIEIQEQMKKAIKEEFDAPRMTTIDGLMRMLNKTFPQASHEDKITALKPHREYFPKH